MHKAMQYQNMTKRIQYAVKTVHVSKPQNACKSNN